MTTIPREKPDVPPVKAPAKKAYRVIGTAPRSATTARTRSPAAPSTAPTCNYRGCYLEQRFAVPTAHARILSIDTAPALAVPGVRAVVTRDDFPDPHHRTEELGEARSTSPT